MRAFSSICFIVVLTAVPPTWGAQSSAVATVQRLKEVTQLTRQAEKKVKQREVKSSLRSARKAIDAACKRRKKGRAYEAVGLLSNAHTYLAGVHNAASPDLPNLRELVGRAMELLIFAKDSDELLKYEEARQSDSVSAYEEFINLHPTSFRRRESEGRIELLRYNSLLAEDRAGSYEAFLQTYPNSKYFWDVKTRLFNKTGSEEERERLLAEVKTIALQVEGKIYSSMRVFATLSLTDIEARIKDGLSALGYTVVTPGGSEYEVLLHVKYVEEPIRHSRAGNIEWTHFEPIGKEVHFSYMLGHETVGIIVRDSIALKPEVLSYRSMSANTGLGLPGIVVQVPQAASDPSEEFSRDYLPGFASRIAQALGHR